MKDQYRLRIATDPRAGHHGSRWRRRRITPLRSEGAGDAILVDAVEQLEADESTGEREPPSEDDYVPV